jgi:tetratricopeptide (TPR) repeat protein
MGLWRIMVAALWVAVAAVARGSDTDSPAVFDAAAKMYEQGNYREAIARYESLLTNGVATPSVLFNLGNARLQLDQVGLAIAAYRKAREGAPRDPAIRSNLRVARSRVQNGPPPPESWMAGWLLRLSAGEWAALALVLNWATAGALAAREFASAQARARWGGWIFVLGVTAVLAAALAIGAGVIRSRAEVVLVESTEARFGPLAESPAAFELPDGAEVRVTDRKDDWLQVRDSRNRAGWVQSAFVAGL